MALVLNLVITNLPVAKTGATYEIKKANRAVVDTGNVDIASDGTATVDVEGLGLSLNEWVFISVDDFTGANFSQSGRAADWIQVADDGVVIPPGPEGPWSYVGIPYVTDGNLITSAWPYDATDDSTLAAPALPSNWTGDVAGFYYVDNNTGSSGPTFGNPSAPLDKIPRIIPAGSVVVMAGGIYDVNHESPDTITFQGTSANQSWLIADNPSAPPICRGKWEVKGTHGIIQDIDAASASFGTDTDQMGISIEEASYITVRRCDWGGNIAQGGWGVKTSSFIYIYDCDIHDCGNLNPASDIDEHGINLVTSDDIWVIKSRIHHVSGDSVQIGGQDGDGPTSLNRVYVAGNTCYSNRQTGLWVKEATDVIISSNIVYDMINGAFADALCYGGQYDHDNVWIVNNIGYNSWGGVKFAGGSGNQYIIGNLFYDLIASPGFSETNPYNSHAISVWAGNNWVINNTIQNCHAGISVTGSKNITSENNLIGNTTLAGGSLAFFEDPANKVSDHNFYQGPPSLFRYTNSSIERTLADFQTQGWDANSQQDTVVGFTDEANNDFTLAVGSPCIGTGKLSSVYATFLARYGDSIAIDIIGTPRPTSSPSIGAYEAGGVLPNNPPVGTMTLTPTLLVVVGTNDATDPDGGSVTYLWDMGDGTTYTTSSVNHTYDDPTIPSDPAGQNFTVTLTVTDEDDGELVLQELITVYDFIPVNLPPTGTMTLTPTLLVVAGSTDAIDPEGGPLQYHWDMDDSTTYNTRTIDHTYAVAGTYDVTLEVLDNLDQPLNLAETLVVTDGAPSLGAELMVNANFTTNDLSDFDISEGSSTYSVDTGTEKMTVVATEGNQDRVAFNVTPTLVDGTQYQVEIEVQQTVGSDGEVKNWVGLVETELQQSFTTSMVLYTFTITATSTSFFGRIYSAGEGAVGDTVVLNRVSVREIL